MSVNLKKIFSRSDVKRILDGLLKNHSGSICIKSRKGELLYGLNSKKYNFSREISLNEENLGVVCYDEECESVQSFINYIISSEWEKKSLAKETLDRYREIKLFEKISEKITANLSLNEVADLIIVETSNYISADNISIMIFNPERGYLEVTASSNYSGKITKTLKPGEGVAGFVFQTGRGEIVNNLQEDSRFVNGDGSIKSMMCVPLKTETSVFGVMNLVSREEVHYTAGDLGLFNLIASKAAFAIENARYIKFLTESTAARERYESELNIAKKIQSSLLPQQVYTEKLGFPFSIYARMDHATQVGGDFYEYFLFDEQHLCFAIGDVAGKGVPAAIFMAVTKTLLKSCVNLYKTPGKILYHMNRDLCKDNHSCMFVTLFLGILDLNTGLLMYASAGHDAPLFISSDKKVSFLDNPEGGPLGVSEMYRFSTYELPLKRNDSIFLYTDGVTEGMNIKGDGFTVERLQKLVEFHRNEKSDQLIHKIMSAIDDFTRGVAQFDDITMLSFTYTG